MRSSENESLGLYIMKRADLGWALSLSLKLFRTLYSCAQLCISKLDIGIKIIDVTVGSSLKILKDFCIHNECVGRPFRLYSLKTSDCTITDI